MRRRITSLFSYAAMAYFLSVFFIFFPYYNWQYARQNGFFSWLLLGEIAATAKAFVWPYYVFMASEGINQVNVDKDVPGSVVHLRKSLSYFSSAKSLMQSLPQSKSPQKDLEAIMELLKQSRDEAER